MNKQKILSRLQATIDQLEKLKPKQFDYSLYVSNYSKRHKCGTVCCVAGWYPKWFPESELEWVYDEMGYINLYDKSREYDTDEMLGIYHDLSNDIINFLFYGVGYRIPKLKSYNIFKYLKSKKYNNKVAQILSKYQTKLKISENNIFIDNGLNSELPYVINMWKLIYDFVDQDII